MIEGHDIICIAPGYWDSPRITHQQFMSLLARRNRVLYVEPPLSYLPFNYPERWKKLSAFAGGTRQESENLWVTCCPPAPPFKRAVNAINTVSQKLVQAWVTKSARRLGFSRPVLWLYLPTAGCLAGGLDESFVLYHCIDEFLAVGWGRGAVIAAQENRLLRQADLTVTCSEAVYETKQEQARRIINVPNGVDYEHYRRAFDDETSVPADLARFSGSRVAGFSGVLDDRLDTEFLLEASAGFPEVQFVLVGPARKAFTELERRQNIHLFGNRPLAALPGYMKGFDVCMVPYRVNDFVQGISPTKLYEYLATGKPVLAPRIRALRGLEGAVHIGDGRDGMLSALGKALADDDPEAARKRSELARENTWRHRVEAVSAEMMDIMAGVAV